MRLGPGVDVPNRHEGVRLPDVITLTVDLAEEAVRLHRRSHHPRPRPRAQERALRRRRPIDDPGRVVVPVASARPVDEHFVDGAELRPPAAHTCLMRLRTENSAPTFLHRSRDGSSRGRHRPGLGEYGKTCTFVTPASASTRRVEANAASSSAGKPTITSAVRLKSPSGASPAQVGRRRVPATHRAQHAIVPRLKRNVEVAGDGRRLAQRPDELVVHVVDLDRREPEPLQAGGRPHLSDEPRERVAGLTVAEAAEVDSREDDFPVALLDPPPHLAQHSGRAAAARRAPHDRNHAEVAREAAPVLHAHEGAHAVEPRVGLDAADRADVAGDELRSLLARPRDDGHVLGQAVERDARGSRRSRSRRRVDGRAPRARRPAATSARPRSSRSTC